MGNSAKKFIEKINEVLSEKENAVVNIINDKLTISVFTALEKNLKNVKEINFIIRDTKFIPKNNEISREFEITPNDILYNSYDIKEKNKLKHFAKAKAMYDFIKNNVNVRKVKPYQKVNGNILIIDDEPIIRRGIKTFIDFEKYKISDVYEAEDGNSAFKTFSEVLPDLVLLDINIPFKNGLTLAEEMKYLKSDVKIAIISGYDYFEYAQKALKIGVEDYILKPVSKTDINEIISKLIYKLEEDKRYNEARKIINKISQIEKSDKNISHSKYKDILTKKIEEKYSDISFNLNSLADEMNLSSGYLSSLFKNLFGIPFQDYLNNMRMEKAKLLLLTTDLKNYQIGELVGMENFNYFNSKFKKTFGMTPKEFKKSVLEKL